MTSAAATSAARSARPPAEPRRLRAATALERVGGILRAVGQTRRPPAWLRDARLPGPTMRHGCPCAGRGGERLGRLDARLGHLQLTLRQSDFAEIFAHVGFRNGI